MFAAFVAEHEIKFDKDNKIVLISIKKHLAELIKSFKEYFPSNDDIKKEDWMRNPFNIDHVNLPFHLSAAEKIQLIDLLTDKTLEDIFKKEDMSFGCVEKPPIYFYQTERSFSCYHSQPHICARMVSPQCCS